MKKTDGSFKIKLFWSSSALLAALFAFIIAAVKFIDVAPIGPDGSSVGLSYINGTVRDLLGASELMYNATELAGLLAIALMGGFALVGLIQLIKRKSLKQVDLDLWLLAALYVIMLAFYVLFEIVVINYRPVLTEGVLEASFPSSHTMLVLTVFGSGIYQFIKHLSHSRLWIIPTIISALIMAFTAFGRLASGVHWFSDIVAAVCLSGAMIFAYVALCLTLKRNK